MKKFMVRRKGFAPTILIAVLALMITVGGVGIGLAWRTNRLDKWLPPNIKEMFGRGEKPEGEEPGGKPGEKPEDLSACGGAISTLESLDETWNKYTNCTLGFSMKVPKEMMHEYGAFCEWDGSSFRPKAAFIPVKIFEDNDNGIVYITSEYYHELGGETNVGCCSYIYSECNKVPNSLARIKEEYLSDNRGHYQQAWKFVIKEIADDNELESYIKERYFPGCKLGQKVATSQEGVYDAGIGPPIGLETSCPINFRYVLKYFPAKKKMANWDTGQAYTFYKILGTGPSDITYDEAMVESFEFLE